MACWTNLSEGVSPGYQEKSTCHMIGCGIKQVKAKETSAYAIVFHNSDQAPLINTSARICTKSNIFNAFPELLFIILERKVHEKYNSLQ